MSVGPPRSSPCFFELTTSVHWASPHTYSPCRCLLPPAFGAFRLCSSFAQKQTIPQDRARMGVLRVLVFLLVVVTMISPADPEAVTNKRKRVIRDAFKLERDSISTVHHRLKSRRSKEIASDEAIAEARRKEQVKLYTQLRRIPDLGSRRGGLMTMGSFTMVHTRNLGGNQR